MTAKEYHALPHLSNSRIKLFRDNRWKFKKWFIDGIQIKDKVSNSTTLGNLTDFYSLQTGENFEDTFTTFTKKETTPQMLKLCNELYNITTENMDDEGKITKSFEELLKESYNSVAFEEGEQVLFKQQKTWDKFLEFFNKSGLDYYTALRENHGKLIVTLKQVEIATKMKENLFSHWVTRGIMTAKTTQDLIVKNQFAHIFTYLGTTIKILLDKLIISHRKKRILIYDLKTCFDHMAFEWNFIDYGYYIQAYLYYIGIQDFARNNGYSDYEIVPMQFIMCPSTFIQSPLIVVTSEFDNTKFKNGFQYGKNWYKGVETLVTEILWHKETEDWSMSMEDFNNNGIRTLNFL